MQVFRKFNIQTARSKLAVINDWEMLIIRNNIDDTGLGFQLIQPKLESDSLRNGTDLQAPHSGRTMKSEGQILTLSF